MNQHEIKRLYFGVCIPIRFLLAYAAYAVPPRFLVWGVPFAVAAAIGWIILTLKPGIRTSGAFGETIWWQNTRPIHAALFLAFAAMVFYAPAQAYIPLLISPFVGMGYYFLFK